MLTTKNKLFFVYDKENNTITNCFLALDEKIAEAVIKDQINKNLKIVKLSKNANEIATIECFLENQKNYQLFEAFEQKKILDLKDLIPEIKNEK